MSWKTSLVPALEAIVENPLLDRKEAAFMAAKIALECAHDASQDAYNEKFNVALQTLMEQLRVALHPVPPLKKYT